MTSGRTSPTVRRRRLAAEMRRLRTARQANLDEVARGSDVGRTTVYRIEQASHAPKVNDIRALCRYYGLSEEETEGLVALARESRQRGWWQRPGPSSSIPSWFETYIGLEEEASELLVYEPELITGLLQTEEYYRSLLSIDPVLPEESTAERDHRVEVRLKRQERLAGPDAPKLWVILNEASIRRTVGGRTVMKKQLEHLVELSRSRRTVLQILPFSAGPHAAVDGSFHILHFPRQAHPSIVYLQFRRGSLYLEEPADLAEYMEIYEHLRAMALSPEVSVELIERLVEELEPVQGRTI